MSEIGGAHSIGVGRRGLPSRDISTLVTSDGQTVMVPSYVPAQPEPEVNKPKELPVETANTIQKEPPTEPKLEGFNDVDVVNLIIPLRVGKGFKAVPDLKEEVWVTEKIDRGSSVVIPKGDIVIRAVNREDGNSGVQKLVDMLVKPDGPLNPELHGVLDDMIGTDDESEKSIG